MVRNDAVGGGRGAQSMNISECYLIGYLVCLCHPFPPLYSVSIEMSPGLGEPSAVPVAEISQRILEGLQVDVVFPDSTYLYNIKAELKKAFKQR